MARNKLDRINQLVLPPALVLLMVVTVIELFYGVSGAMAVLIDIFDVIVIVIFAIDLYFRWFDTPHFFPYVKKHILDIIATIPFNLIFLGVEGLALIRALRGVRIIARVARLARFARYARFIRLLRFGARAPRFIRSRKYVKKGKIRKVQPHEKKMKKVLSFKVILLITINSIMGTGIWFLTSAGAKYAGPASLVSWVILSFIAVYISMCFGELVSMFPKAGGVYEFGKQAYGRFWSFVLGWTTSISGSVTIAMLLLGALQYLIPLQYSFTYVPIAIFLIVLFSYIAFSGMQTSTYMLVTFALITLAAVIGIIVPGLINFSPANLDPFFVFPTMGIALAIFFIAETFFGWESAIFLSAETKDPRKIMPKALIVGTLVIAVLAFLLAFTAMGTIPWQEFAESTAPLRDLGEAHFGFIGKIAFTILIFVSVIGATAGWIVTAPRLLMSIAEDKLFFVHFAKIHPKHKSPYVSIAFQAIIVSILVMVGAGSYETLLHMLIPLILVVYSAVLLSVVILRFKKPEIERPFKVPFGKVGPFLTIGFMIFLIVMFIRETHGALDILRVSGSLIAFGIPAYFAIEMFYDAKYVALRHTFMAKLSHHLHKLPLSKLIFRRVINYVSPLSKSKVVVSMNAPLGSFTKYLIKKKIKFKKIHIVNESHVHIGLIKKHVQHRALEYHKSRSMQLPKVKADVLVSFNTLGHTKNIEKFLQSVKKVLAKNGKFCFYVQNKVLNMTPNAMELADKKKLLHVFKKAGLDAHYTRHKKLFKEQIYVYGRRK
jgi:basic amino acid/polyamine antiporter, APA family